MDVRSFTFDTHLTAGFAELRERLYPDERDGAPAWRDAVAARYSPGCRFYRNPDRHRHFAAVRRGRVIGHVSAFRNPDLRDVDGQPVGALGLFECVDERRVAQALLESAADWLRRQGGTDRAWGPIDFDIWSSYRFKRSGFGHGTFTGEPHNKPYYPSLFEESGFTVRRTWRSVALRGRDALEEVIARPAGRHRRAVAAGCRFRPLDGRDGRDLRGLHSLVTRSYRRFLGFTPIDPADFDSAFAGALFSMDSRFVTLAEDPEGALAGFAIAFPDASGPEGRRIVFHTIGVTPEAIRKRHSLGSALACHVVRTVLAARFDTLLAALVAEDSPIWGILGSRGRQESEYVLYESQT